MKCNALIDILFNWEKMSKTAKIQRLQDLENMVARMQGRKSRIVTTKYDKSLIEMIGEERKPIACYFRREKGKIYFFDLDCSGIYAARTLIHEGFHAYVHDFLSGNIQILKTFSELDEERFKIEEENLPAIHDEFKDAGLMQLFDSYYIEERLNHKETTLYLVKLIIDAIEKPVDSVKLSANFILSFFPYCENETRGRKFEKDNGVTYDEIVIKALNKSEEFEKLDLKIGEISDKIDPGLYSLFERVEGLAKQYYMVEKNSIMMPEVKSRMSDELTSQIMEIYYGYVEEMLKSKKKI